MFIFAPRVADTVSKIVKMTPGASAYIYVVLAGLLRAIVWDLFS
jgi:PiT family inorganic phosphate transporter